MLELTLAEAASWFQMKISAKAEAKMIKKETQATILLLSL